MGWKINGCLALICLVLLCCLYLFIEIDYRINFLNNEMDSKIATQNYEIEELKRSQRLTAQDVQFLENLVVEKEEK